MFSPLMVSAAVISPAKKYAAEIDEHFRSPAIRELLYGFPTYSGFDPQTAPASLAIIPWTIIREGVWYPAERRRRSDPEGPCGGLPGRRRRGPNRRRGRGDRAGFDRAPSRASPPPPGRSSRGRSSPTATTSAPIRCCEGARTSGASRRRSRRSGPRRPSLPARSSRSNWRATAPGKGSAHHILVLTEGSARVYDELFGTGRVPERPANLRQCDLRDRPRRCPPRRLEPVRGRRRPALEAGRGGRSRGRGPLRRQAHRAAGKGGIAGPRRGDGHAQDHRARPTGAIGSWPSGARSTGSGNAHNVLGGSFRPLNYRADVPGLYFVGGGVQPGAGLPMVVQSGKITAERLARDLGRGARR